MSFQLSKKVFGTYMPFILPQTQPFLLESMFFIYHLKITVFDNTIII